MRKLGESINELMDALAAGDDASRKAQRAAAVNVAWRNAVEAVYKDAAQMVLDHVNAVYIMAADEVVKGATTKASHTGTGAQLVVYADDSLIRSDLDARQEFLKMKLKAHHPFCRAEEDGAVERAARASREEAPRTPLSPEEEAALEASVGAVESPTVRRALERAIRADKNRI